MSDQLLVECCAPTLAGLKTGSLFSCPCPDRAQLQKELRSMNRRLASRGLRILPLRFSGSRALLYLFRPERLGRDLSAPDAREILEGRGYGGLSPAACLRLLSRRLRQQEAFPHEVGLFLGYPPEDVKGFILNRAGNYKFIGVWKVYGDEAAARKTFDRYKQCTISYLRQLAAGIPVERLAVG